MGRSKRPADDSEILTMIRDSSRWLWENQVYKEQELTFEVLAKFAKEKNLSFNESKCKTLKLMNEKSKFTNAGLLLSDQNPIEVKFAVYDKDMNFKIKKVFQGSIVSIADEVLNYAEQFNDISAKIISGQISRVERKSYPGASLREGILNAICHADYSLPSNIKVEFFRDKLRIINPGNVYNSTLEAVLGGVQTFRNPALVNIIYKLDFIENYGTGPLRIKETYENEELKPEFKVIDRYFFLTLPNLNKDSYFFIANEAKKDTTKTLEEQVAELIKGNNSISKAEMALIAKKSKSTIDRLLKQSKLIIHVGPKKGGHWEIVDSKKEN